MPRCSNCRRELPGLETLCQECFESGYDRLVHPKPWWRRLQLRLTLGNLFGFCLLFVLSFAILRFDFPEFHANHKKTTETSAVISILVACVAFFYEDKGKSKSTSMPAKSVEGAFDWGRFLLLGAGELLVGVVLYALFRFTPMAVQVIFGLMSWIIVRIDIYDSKRTNSMGYRLCTVTAVPSTFCLIAWRITDRDVWMTLMLVCCTLMAGLIVLDRWEDFE